MNELLLTTLGHGISGALSIALGIFVILRDPRRLLYWLFLGFTTFTGLFGVLLAFAINLDPSPLTYVLWVLTAGNFIMVACFFHFTLRFVERDGKYRLALWLSYGIAFLSFFISVIFPHLFISGVTPKLFTKSYFSVGPLYEFMILYFLVILIVAGYELFRGYLYNKEDRRRYEYALIAVFLGYGTGPWDFALGFDIPVSPMFGMLYGLYAIPIAYGIVSEQLLDVRVVIKRAAVYAVGVALTAGALVALILLNEYIVRAYPWIQFWTIPTISACFAFVFGRIFWTQAIEADELKYTFITVATHKLRTPLTRIRWVLDGLKDSNDPTALHVGLDHIARSNMQLIETTNTLLEAAHTGNAAYQYKRGAVSLRALIQELIKRHESGVTQKRHTVSVSAKADLVVTGDPDRLSSVIDVLLENAITYTPSGGAIDIALVKNGGSAKVSVHDTGIGVSAADITHIFSRLFRTQKARIADTEGLGLGLFMAKNIVEKHGGTMGVSSPGEGRGSTFWFTIPLAKS